MNLNPFKRKKKEELQVEEEENQFQPYEENEPSDTIETEEEERERRGRRLKSKVIAGGALAVALIVGYMMLSNLFAPQEKQEAQQVETRRNIGDVELKGAPQNYEQLAKYDANRKRQQEEAKRAEEERIAKEKAKMNPPKAQQADAEKTPVRKVEPPKQSSYASKVNLPPSPSVPSVPNVRGSQERGDASANKSGIGFSVGGGGANALFGSYSAAADSRVDTGASYTIQAGTVVPATLLMGIDTRMSDVITAQIRQDVYDSLTGQHLLLPQGSRLIGKVSGSGRRVGVEFQRIILPDGTSVAIPQQKAVDNQGFGGMKDKYDHHDSDFYRGALISAVVGFFADAVDDHFDRRNTKNNGDSSAAESAMTKAVDNITDHIMERSSKTESPNSIIRQGFQFNVLITQDFNAYEYLR